MKRELCVLCTEMIICQGCLTLASFDTEFSRKEGRKGKPAIDFLSHEANYMNRFQLQSMLCY